MRWALLAAVWLVACAELVPVTGSAPTDATQSPDLPTLPPVADVPPAPEPLLKSLESTAGEMVPAFLPEQHTYTVSLGMAHPHVSLLAVPGAGALVRMGEEPLAAGVPSQPVEVPMGATEVEVTASRDGETAVYTVKFVRSMSVEAVLQAAVPADQDQFGASVALDGDTLVVGAPLHDACDPALQVTQCDNAGAAYVFERSMDKWTQMALLLPPEGVGLQWFGRKVAIAGDRMVVGAPFSHTIDMQEKAEQFPGRAYVYARAAKGWQLQASLQPGPKDSLFGQSVAVAGDTVVVSAKTGVYLFSPGVGGAWTSGAQFEGDNARVAGSGVHASFAWPGSAARLLTQVGAGWSPISLAAAPAGLGAGCGASLALLGDRLLVGCERSSGCTTPPYPPACALAGAAISFELQQGSWVATDTIRAENADTAAFSADHIALAEDIAILAGAPHTAYLFARRGQTVKKWMTESQFQIGGAAIGWDSWDVALSGDTAAFGAPHDQNCKGAGKKRTCIQPGSVFIFR